jgi:N-formylglutamate deformylase
VPPEERQTILLDDAELHEELLRMTDAYTDELFPPTPVEAARFVFSISRLICDVERFLSDEDEPMAARGMGAVYTRTSSGRVLRIQPNPETRRSVLNRWYWPHHSKLERTVKDVARRLGFCLIVDCHSFPSVALPYELDQTEVRADFCIGTDPFHTPSSLRDAIIAAVRQARYSVSIDAPFAGALVPLSLYRKDRRIHSVMIEVNRRLYMDEHSGLKAHAFEQVRGVVKQLIITGAETVIRSEHRRV